jgi:HSP20 family molecular chaperone IbpA
MLFLRVRETHGGFNIQLDMPGVDKNDISVTIYRNNELRIAAHKYGLIKTDDSNMQRTERYTRTLMFPEHGCILQVPYCLFTQGCKKAPI